MTYSPREDVEKRAKDFEGNLPKFMPRQLRKPLITMYKIAFAQGYHSAQKVLELEGAEAEIRLLDMRQPFDLKEVDDMVKVVK